MSDGLDIDARIRDRIEALWRVLGDPNLGPETKCEEIASVCRRIDSLEDQRERHLSVVADALAARAVDA